MQAAPDRGAVDGSRLLAARHRDLAGAAGGRRPLRPFAPRGTRPRGMGSPADRSPASRLGIEPRVAGRRPASTATSGAASRTAMATPPWRWRPARSPWASTSSGWLRASSLGWRTSRTARTECALLASLDDPRDLCATFYELWTLKEAFAKALQLPLVDALRQCRFVDAGLDRRADVPTNRHWRATVFAPRPQLRLAVARIADAPEQLDAPLATFEWPQPRRCDWTVIRSLAGGGPADARANVRDAAHMTSSQQQLR